MSATTAAIEIKNLTVKFGTFTAVNNVSFTVDKGEIFGFLGANGAGKTTTIRVLCGLLDAASGEIHIEGRDALSDRMWIKENIGYMSQKFTLYDDLTVGENMAFKAALRRLPKEYAHQRMNELLAFVGFKHPLSELVKDLPQGVKQQVSLAASILHDPAIIFLDEPTSGVSPSVRRSFWELIQGLAKNGKTIIVTTHYMDEAEQCGRIALMRTGELIALDSPAGLKKLAYPGPVAEIRAQTGINTTALLAHHDILASWPYGLKYHAAFQSTDGAHAFLAGLPAGVMGKIITPSLEDVFIKLVEGAER